MTGPVAIVGGGLAGVTLAWQLHIRGMPTVVLDRGEPATASRVAAGLVTPVTGRRPTAAWRFAELFPTAEAFYRRVEAETGTPLFTRRPVVRLFADAAEKVLFEDRRPGFGDLVSGDEPAVNPDWIAAPLGAFEMPAAGQLAVPAYLESARRFVRRETVDLDAEPLLPWAGRVVLCDGAAGRAVRLTAVKGEVLTVRIPGLSEERVVNRGGFWLAPQAGEFYRAGATYTRDDPHGGPTAAGREEIVGKLRSFLRLPFAVEDHAAAARPVTRSRKPVLGMVSERVGVLNGFGSKGVLFAPFFAGQLADALLGRGGIDTEVDVRNVI